MQLNREEFITLPPEKRVEEVNDMLKRHTLKEIANMLGFKYSTFTTEMRNNGEYRFLKKNKQYVRAVTLGDVVKNEDNEAIVFINENKQALKRLIEIYQSNNLLVLDEKVYSKKAMFENKSIKMNKDIYSDYSKFCDNHFPHLKMQDMIAQSLLDFMEKYKR